MAAATDGPHSVTRAADVENIHVVSGSPAATVSPRPVATAMQASGPSPAGPKSRYVALDGLRGLAAMVVLICHAMLVAPGYSAAYGIGQGNVSGWAWLLTYTPVHILWAGTEAVYLFFVLSGFVLTLSVSRGTAISWPVYYVRRLVRLYLPVWAVVAFAVLTFAVVAHRSNAQLSGWMNVHSSKISMVNLARDTSLLDRPGAFATQLWSLKWEVVFSLLLPVFWLVSRRIGARWWQLKIAALLIAVALGQLAHMFWLFYLPMFAIGVMMVAAIDQLGALAGRLTRLHWSMLGAGALLLLTAKWSVAGVYGAQESSSWPLETLAVFGGTLLVYIFCFNGTAKRVTSLRGVKWLGRRSFSLYLVHEPIIVTLAFAFSLRNGWVALMLSLPVCLLVAAVFFSFVEAPSQRLANRVGQSAQRRLAQRRAS